MKLNFDMLFRKKRFEQVIADGLLNELVLAHSYIEALIKREEQQIKFWREVWQDRIDSIHRYEDKFRSYGYESAEDYLDREMDEDYEDDLHYEFLAWMNLIINPEHQKDHNETIKKHEKEIKECKKVLADLETITHEVARHPNASLDKLTALFEKHDVLYLIHLKQVVQVGRIIDNYYFGTPRAEEQDLH
jgi:hypothetical protein